MSRLKLNSVEWKEFKITNIFNVFTGAIVNKTLLSEGTIPRITATDSENGVAFFTKRINHKNFRIYRNFISISFLGSTFYQSNEVSLDMKIHGIKPKFTELNKEIALFLMPLIKNFTFKYRYGYQLSTSILKMQKIMLPINSEGAPNWQFMEDYIKQEQKEQALKLIDYYEQRILKCGFELLGLEDVKWKEFKFEEVFKKIQRGKRLIKNNQIQGDTPYISSTAMNNGVDNFISNEENVRIFEDCLTLANSGSVGSCFYHYYEFIASDHVTSLKLNKSDKHIYLFMASIIKRLEAKYSFNREINDKRIRQEKIILPIDKNGNPYYEYMRIFMQELENKKLAEVLEYIYIYIYKLAIFLEKSKYSLSCINMQWKEFWLEDIVDIKSGIDIYQKERVTGDTPYITATAANNGIGYFVDNINKTIEENCISVNRNGSVGYSFYHPYKALYGNDTRKLIPKVKNKYISLFITNCITHQKDKYGYGYKMGTGRLKRQKIMLPTNKNGEVNYDFMRKYMIIQEVKESYKIIEYLTKPQKRL